MNLCTIIYYIALILLTSIVVRYIYKSICINYKYHCMNDNEKMTYAKSLLNKNDFKALDLALNIVKYCRNRGINFDYTVYKGEYWEFKSVEFVKFLQNNNAIDMAVEYLNALSEEDRKIYQEYKYDITIFNDIWIDEKSKDTYLYLYLLKFKNTSDLVWAERSILEKIFTKNFFKEKYSIYNREVK